MKGYEFERELVAVIVEIAARKGIKAKPLAEKAWGVNGTSAVKWRKIRNGDDPRGLMVRDAFMLAEALGESFSEICAAAKINIQARLLELPEKKLSDASVIPTQDQGTHVHGAADQG